MSKLSDLINEEYQALVEKKKAITEFSAEDKKAMDKYTKPIPPQDKKKPPVKKEGAVNEISPELAMKVGQARSRQADAASKMGRRLGKKQVPADDPIGKAVNLGKGQGRYDVAAGLRNKAINAYQHASDSAAGKFKKRGPTQGELPLKELSPELINRYNMAPGGGYARTTQAQKNTMRALKKYGATSPETIGVLDANTRAFGKTRHNDPIFGIKGTHPEYYNKKTHESKLAESFKNVVRNEFRQMLKEAEEKGPDVSAKLETLRKKLVKEGQITVNEKGSGKVNRAALPERRMPIATVSKLTEVPINELLLFFLNGERITENEVGEFPKFHYGLGQIFFYGTPDEMKV